MTVRNEWVAAGRVLRTNKDELLARLLASCEAGAPANTLCPLDSCHDLRAVAVPPHELNDAEIPRDFLRSSHWVPSTVVSNR